MKLVSSKPVGQRRVYDIEVADVHNFYANGVNVHNCATDGGVSVIKDDGTVVDWLTNGGSMRAVHIEDSLIIVSGGTGIGYRTWGLDFIPTSDTNSTTFFTDTLWSASKIVREGSVNNSSMNKVVKIGEGIAFPENAGASTNNKLFLVDSTDSPIGYNNTAHISSSYNTGWMNGDIKLATLSDTDATNVTGTELVTNGTFDTDTSGWTALADTTISLSSGSMLVTAGTNSLTAGAYQSISVESFKTYTVSFDFTLVSGTCSFRVMTGANAGTISAASISSSGTYTLTFKTSATTVYLNFLYYNASGQSGKFDNVSVRLAESDRSVNGNGLQVFGTVTKTPVATGADLVAYRGSSSSNYIKQPYNSDLDFGTGDLCVSFWYQTDSPSSNVAQMIFSNRGTSLNNFRVFFASSALSIRVGSISTGSVSYTNTGWSLIHVVKRSGTVYTYINGVLMATQSDSTGNISMPNGLWVLGDGVSYFTGHSQVSLFRISATAPTAAQIAQIYSDEKVLFQDGAQATLYGSSDSVVALAFDSDAELLSVGTSAGRSDFKGLRRVNNTTTAVTTAISASNSMIVEQ